MTERYCVVCGRPFDTTHACAPHKRFCSTSCRNAWHYEHTIKPARQARRPMKPIPAYAIRGLTEEEFWRIFF